MVSYILGGDFEDFFIFTPILREMIQFVKYFSGGLQPTSNGSY